MAITIRGGSPATASGTGVVSVTLTGTRQPQLDDVLLIIHGNDYYQLSNMSTPTVDGSTSGVGATGATADGGNLFAHVKTWTWVAPSASDRTVAAVETGTADEEKCLIVYVLIGVDTASPLAGPGAGNFDSGAGTQSHVAPSVTPSTSDAFLICHSNDGNGSDGGTSTAPGSMTEQYDSSVGGFMSFTGATEQLVASGATGTRTFTSVGNSTYGAISVAMKTASGGGGASPDPQALVVPPAALIRASTW